jgi:Bacterial Ig domain
MTKTYINQTLPLMALCIGLLTPIVSIKAQTLVWEDNLNAARKDVLPFSMAANIVVNIPDDDGYCGTVANGDYQYKVVTFGTNVSFTFHPLSPITGCNLALIYIREGAGGYEGVAMTAVGPDFIYNKTIANNTPLSIYFTYNTPPVGERNSSATPHAYTVGANCTGGTPPTVSVTSPTNNTTYTEPVALINISATAADADGTISKVEFYNGTTLLSTKTSAPYSLDLTNVAAGNYFISAKATDNSGLFTLSSIVKVIVNPDNSSGFCGTLANGDYSYKAVTVGSNVEFLFHPLSPIQGCALSIIYIKEGSGGFAGNNMTAVGNDFKYTRAVAAGTPLSIYFTYSTPPTGERNSSATPHSYTVGANCLIKPTGNTSITPAPTPTRTATNVISLFSNAYTNRPVETWSAGWDNADVSDTLIANNDTKIYTKLDFAGIEFKTPVIDATTMTHFHLDVWNQNSTKFNIKLVDFGANGIFQGVPNDDTEHELSFTPALGSWVSYDLPLSNFTNMTSRAHLAQLILVGSNSKVYVDNIYFYKEMVSNTASVNTGKNILILKNTLVHDVLDVTVTEDQKGPLSIFNVSGQLMYSKTIQGNQLLDLSALSSGMYIVRTLEGAVRRFVKD